MGYKEGGERMRGGGEGRGGEVGEAEGKRKRKKK